MGKTPDRGRVPRPIPVWPLMVGDLGGMSFSRTSLCAEEEAISQNCENDAADQDVEPIFLNSKSCNAKDDASHWRCDQQQDAEFNDAAAVERTNSANDWANVFWKNWLAMEVVIIRFRAIGMDQIEDPSCKDHRGSGAYSDAQHVTDGNVHLDIGFRAHNSNLSCDATQYHLQT
jgi:hypothetical protein